MALEIFWSKRADQKFDRVLDYLLSEWGEKVTVIFVKKVYDFLDILVEFPEIGSIENIKRNIRGFVITRQITVYYRISDKKIILVNFFDNRQCKKEEKY